MKKVAKNEAKTEAKTQQKKDAKAESKSEAKSEAKFEDLFREGLEDLHDAEKQIVTALPKMVAAASSEELAEALQDHLDQTKEQVRRLERIFEQMSEQPGGRECQGMKGLLAEGEKLIAEHAKSPVLDVALIDAGQKVEHYEIAAYTNMCALAEMLGQQEAFELLEETLEEEKDANEALAEISDSLLGGETGEDMEEDVEAEDEEVEEA